MLIIYTFIARIILVGMITQGLVLSLSLYPSSPCQSVRLISRGVCIASRGRSAASTGSTLLQGRGITGMCENPNPSKTFLCLPPSFCEIIVPRNMIKVGF